jgi:hypothetical protein
LFIFSSTVGGAHNTYGDYSRDEIKAAFKNKGLKSKFLFKTVDVILDVSG